MAKGNGDSTLVTQDMLQQAVDAILAGMDNMQRVQREERKEEIQGFRNEMNSKFKGVDGRFDQMNSRFDDTQEQIENLDEKVDANYKSTNGKIKMVKTASVSREEFEELRDEVRRLKKSFASG